MPVSRRRKWLLSITGTDSVRSAAEAVGVNHGTVSRWLRSGMPMTTLTDLILRFRCDPIEAVVVWGYLKDECVPHLNYAEIVQYAPLEVLRAEIARRIDGVEDTQRKTTTRKVRRA